MLNKSDVGTYMTFLDAIVKRYNESPHRGLCGGRRAFYQNNFYTEVFSILAFSPERFICKEKYSAVVERNICHQQDLSDQSGHFLKDLQGEPLEGTFYLEELKEV